MLPAYWEWLPSTVLHPIGLNFKKNQIEMVQGLARQLHSARTDAVLLKLDITKAFDTVDWGF